MVVETEDRSWLAPLTQRLYQITQHLATDPADRLAQFHRRVLEDFFTLRSVADDKRTSNRTGPMLRDAFKRFDGGDQYAVVRKVKERHRASTGYHKLSDKGRHEALWETLMAEYSDLFEAAKGI